MGILQYNDSVLIYNNMFLGYNMPDTSTVTDIDGNTYITIKIGDTWWMAEPLKTLTLNDGTPISTWVEQPTRPYDDIPCYCWYDDNSTLYSEWGVYYSWYAVNTGKLAPAGWNVASKNDWDALCYYAGGKYVNFNGVWGSYREAGEKLKETGTTHWVSPNAGATNEFGLNLIGSGYRQDVDPAPPFMDLGYYGCYWTSTDRGNYQNQYSQAYAIWSYYDYGICPWDSSSLIQHQGFAEKSWGQLVLCVKDD